MRLTGAQILFKALEGEGVEVVFGIPGGAIMPIYDALIDSSIRHVLMRHEQSAGHAAEGYSHVTGRVGVCMATSGPGGCNLVTPIADAMMDSIPILAITGQVSRAAMGKQAFQEAPITDITRPITKRNWLVMDPAEIAPTIREAFRFARSGRPGPVLVDIPKDVQLETTEWRPGGPADGRDQPSVPSAADLAAAANLIAGAGRPVLYVGGGVLKSAASAELRELAATWQIPVVTTLMARGAFPDSDPLAFGMPGMHGGYAAVMAMQRADLLICVGARFDDRVTGRLDGFAPEARVIHIDVDPGEIGKVRKADVGLVGDARAVLVELNSALVAQGGGPDPEGRRRWLTTLDEWRKRHPFRHRQDANGPLKPQEVIRRLYELTGGRALVAAGVGQHQMWASQLWRFERPRSWASSGGLGTMGFALPAALGAKIARPDELVVAIDGDGCFQMTAQELATSVSEDIPVLVAIINNGHLGMVHQWQQMFHGGRTSQVRLGQNLPDYVGLARSYGCLGLRAERPQEVDPVIELALAEGERTVVIDFRVDETEMCFPIVPAGATNDEIVLGAEIAGAACAAG